jgi:hypothetical protein
MVIPMSSSHSLQAFESFLHSMSLLDDNRIKEIQTLLDSLKIDHPKTYHEEGVFSLRVKQIM